MVAVTGRFVPSWRMTKFDELTERPLKASSRAGWFVLRIALFSGDMKWSVPAEDATSVAARKKRRGRLCISINSNAVPFVLARSIQVFRLVEVSSRSTLAEGSDARTFSAGGSRVMDSCGAAAERNAP